MVFFGISCITAAPAPMIDPVPIVTPLRIIAFTPIHTLSCICALGHVQHLDPLSAGASCDLCIWKYGKSNGRSEGLNNKVKVLKRVAFGLHNFDSFRRRILWKIEAIPESLGSLG